MSGLFKKKPSEELPLENPDDIPETPLPPIDPPKTPPVHPNEPPTGVPVLDGRADGEYTTKFLSAKIKTENKSDVEWAYHQIVKNKARYENVASRMGNAMPWWVVGAIHMLEADFDFTTHLHNGDSLLKRTVHVPAGRPEGDPPFTWEQSAVDALKYDGADTVRRWDLDSALAWCEKYNGLGYKRRNIPSPYIWSFTNQYSRGRFVADGRFDANSVSKQVGVAAILLEMQAQGAITIRVGDPVIDDDPVDVPTSLTPWLDIARKEIGVHERTGGENPRIIEYHDHTSLKATEDEVPWCAAFACWCLDKAGFATTNSAWAQSFALYGEKLKGPKIGCIVPFRWSSTAGHVGFCVGFGEGYVDILGGNQSDPDSGGSVSIKRFNLDNVMGYRWPVKEDLS